jgi:hypothetical protein
VVQLESNIKWWCGTKYVRDDIVWMKTFPWTASFHFIHCQLFHGVYLYCLASYLVYLLELIQYISARAQGHIYPRSFEDCVPPGEHALENVYKRPSINFAQNGPLADLNRGEKTSHRYNLGCKRTYEQEPFIHDTLSMPKCPEWKKGKDGTRETQRWTHWSPIARVPYKSP